MKMRFKIELFLDAKNTVKFLNRPSFLHIPSLLSIAITFEISRHSVKVVTITKELTHKRFQHAIVVLFNWPWLNKDLNID